MILSKANLSAVLIAADDKTIPMLHNLHLCEDGTTVAANGRAILAVSPVPEKIREGLGYMEDSGSLGEVTLAADTVKEVLRNMPRDAKFGGLLEFTDAHRQTGGVRFRLLDGMREKSIGAKVYARPYFAFRAAFTAAFGAGTACRGVLNRKRLTSLLVALDKICPDTSGEAPVYLEFTKGDDVLLRAEGHTGQRVLALMKAYSGAEGQWLPVGEWERAMSSVEKPKRKPTRKKNHATQI